MRIGIDIDGVLTDVCAYQIDVASKYFYLKEKKTIKNYKAYYSYDMFDIDKKTEINFWDNIVMEYANNEPPRKFASEVIGKLKDEGNEIYIITARTRDVEFDPKSENEMHEVVANWFDKNNIYYDKIIYTKEKLKICKENNIDIMIEDKPENICSIATEIPVFCYNAFYNEDIKGDNITRVYSWYDIYAKIQEITKL